MSIRRLIHHDGSALYVSPSNPELGDIVEVRLRIPAELVPTRVAVRVVRDGEPVFHEATPIEAPIDCGTDTWWSAQIELHNPRTNYRWSVAGGNVGYGWINQQGWVDHDVNDSADFVITSFSDIAPWAREAVIYQIFPDRFAKSEKSYEIPSWAVPKQWNERPDGASENTSQEYFGGDLWGVIENLDYLEKLGVTALYFTPIFPAHSVHRYDASSFHTVDPLLGGDEALIALTDAAHQRGMKVIGDITLNHSGHHHEWFTGAQVEDSTTREFYTFDDTLEHGYEAWLGVRSLPKFNYTSPALREILFSGPDSVIRRWLNAPFNLDGWRVDVANMSGRQKDIDLNHEVARLTRQAVKAEGTDKILIGEHNHDAGPDLDGDGWQGNMNYTGFRNPVVMWLAGDDIVNVDNGNYREVPHGIIPRVNAQTMLEVVQSFSSRMPWKTYSASWNLLSSHDSPRIRYLVGNPLRQIAAAVLMMGMPGTPMIFAGDEIGMQGRWGEDSRTPHPWQDIDSWDQEMLAVYSALNKIRTSSDALSHGGLRIVHIESDAFVFMRESNNERLLICVARQEVEKIKINTAQFGITSVEQLFGFNAQVDVTDVEIEVTSAGGGVWRINS